MSSDSKEYLETHPVRREIVRVYNPRVTVSSAVNELKQKLGNVSSLKSALDVLSSAVDDTTGNIVSNVEDDRSKVSDSESVIDEACSDKKGEYTSSAGVMDDTKADIAGTGVKDGRSDGVVYGLLTKRDLMRGIVAAEILGPPKGRATGRRYGKF